VGGGGDGSACLTGARGSPHRVLVALAVRRGPIKRARVLDPGRVVRPRTLHAEKGDRVGLEAPNSHHTPARREPWLFRPHTRGDENEEVAFQARSPRFRGGRRGLFAPATPHHGTARGGSQAVAGRFFLPTPAHTPFRPSPRTRPRVAGTVPRAPGGSKPRGAKTRKRRSRAPGDTAVRPLGAGRPGGARGRRGLRKKVNWLIDARRQLTLPGPVLGLFWRFRLTAVAGSASGSAAAEPPLARGLPCVASGAARVASGAAPGGAPALASGRPLARRVAGLPGRVARGGALSALLRAWRGAWEALGGPRGAGRRPGAPPWRPRSRRARGGTLSWLPRSRRVFGSELAGLQVPSANGLRDEIVSDKNFTVASSVGST